MKNFYLLNSPSLQRGVRGCLLFLALVATTTLWAYDFQSGNLYYELTSDSTAMVTSKSASSPYNVGVTITSAIIPSSVSYSGKTFAVTAIDDYAFWNCTSLASVTIPTSIIEIGFDAFYGTSLYNNSSKWENDVLYIGDCLIKAKPTLSGSYVIKSNTRLVAKSAFKECSSLTAITIPENVQLIGRYCFHYCESLAKVVWNAKKCAEFYKSGSSGNYLFSNAPVTSFIFGEGVEHIPGSICFGLELLTSITIPANVTSIGDHAFDGCYMLNSVVLGNNVTTIGSYAFDGCSSLTSVTIPNSVTSIGRNAFYDCSSLTSIIWNAKNCANFSSSTSSPFYAIRSQITSFKFGNSVACVPDYLCSGMDKVQSISIPNSVTTIGNDAFYGCSSLASVIIPNSVTSIGYSAFYGCSSLTSITWNAKNCANFVSQSYSPFYAIRSQITSFKFGNSVACVPDYLCSGMDKVQSISIPNSVTIIGNDAFYGCSSLASVIISENVTTIGNYAFSGCSSLASVIIPENVTTIGKFAFDGCSSLASVIIPENVTTIGNSAFYNCTSLSSITTHAENPSIIGNNAFYGVRKTIPVYVPCGSVVSYKAAEGWKNFTNIQEPLSEYSLIIDTQNAAMGSASVDKNTACGAQISATANEGYFFKQWSDGNTDNPRALVLNRDTNLIAEFEKDNTTIDSTYCIYYTSSDGNIITPKSLDAFGANLVSNIYQDSIGVITFDGVVTSIGYYAFEGSSLASIIIPNGVTNIGEGAFTNCSSLISIKVEKDNAIYDSREDCNAIIQTATNTLIAGCQNTIIPNGVMQIANSAFEGCSSLTNIIIPNGVTAIGSYAFQNCSSLESINIPNDIKNIEASTFFGCSSLTSIVIPNSVTRILESAFEGCSSLFSIEIGESVTTIENRAFFGCYSINTIYCYPVAPPEILFLSTFENCKATVYVPCQTVDAYKAAYGWRIFADNIQEPLPAYSIFVSAQNNEMGEAMVDRNTYCEGAQISATANEGYLFKQWSDGNTDNPRTLVLDKDTSLIAEFEVEQKSCLIASGICGLNGDNLTWQLSCDSILTIMGEGEMSEYSYGDYGINPPWTEYAPQIKSIVVKEGVTSIGTYAFYNYSTAKYCSLKDITIPTSLTKTGASVFSGITSMESVYITDLEVWMDITHASSAGNPLSVAHHLYVNGVELTELVVPDGVKTIKKYVFCGCEGLKSLQLPNSIELIENDAFAGTGLIQLVLPEGLEVVDNGAFYDCLSLEKLYISSTVRRLGNNAFGGCDSLKGVYITDLEAWCNLTMEYSSPLTDAHHLYLNDLELTEVVFPENCSVVKNYTFEGCSYIKSIQLHDNITSIGSSAFRGCSSLESLVIPASISYIGSCQFWDCTALKQINFLSSTPPEISQGAVIFYRTNTDIIVPCGSKDKYISVINNPNVETYWIDSLRFVEEAASLYTYSVTTSNEEQGAIAYLQRPTYCDNLTLSFRADANDGYIFRQWSDGNTDNPRTLVLTQDTVLTAIFAQFVYADIYEETCDSYSWNGQVYTESGEYTYRTTASNGCDSIVTLHLTINTSKTFEETIVACDSYTWNGQVYTESGEYTYRTTASNGCDSVVTLHLTINTSKTFEETIVACDSYTWNGQVYTESGEYTYRTTASNGCDSVVTLHLTINTAKTFEETIVACDSYTWNGQVYTESGEYTYRTTASNGCDSVVTLHLTINTSKTFEETIVACDSYSWNGQVYTESGEYTYRTTASNGCDSVVTLHLTINTSKTFEETIVTCDSYTWNGEVYTESGDYTYRTTASNGCDSVVTLHLTINTSKTFEETIVACDSYTWNGQVYTESGDYTYRTTASNGCDSVVTLHLTINTSKTFEETIVTCDSYTWNGQVYTESGEYTYRTTASNGCDSVVTLHLTINKSAVAEMEYATICNGETYTWNGAVYNQAGDYSVTLNTVAGCDSVVSLKLTVLPAMQTEEQNLELCTSDLPYSWYGQTLTEAGTYTYIEQYAGYTCDSVEHVLNLQVHTLVLPSSISLPIAVCGHPMDVSAATADIEAFIVSEPTYAANATVAWQQQQAGIWTALSTQPLDGDQGEVIVRYMIISDCGVLEAPEMVVPVEMPTPENSKDLDGVKSVSKYNNRIFLFHLNDFVKKYGWTPQPEQVIWYKVVGDMDAYGAPSNDMVVGIGHSYNLPDGSVIKGDYYALIIQDSPNSNGCTSVYRTVVLTATQDENNSPALVPNVVQPNAQLSLQNLDPTKVYEVRVYDTSGDCIATYMAEYVSEFLFNANHVAGYYLVDVINENNKITLRYVVK